MKSKSTISNSTRSSEVIFLEIVTRKFIYTRLAITGSLTGVETEKCFERVAGLILNLTTILSYKRQSRVYCFYIE